MVNQFYVRYGLSLIYKKKNIVILQITSRWHCGHTVLLLNINIKHTVLRTYFDLLLNPLHYFHLGMTF